MEKLRKELVEKQVLLNQAARAFKLYEEQKAATSRTQDQYQQSLEKEREKVTKLERGKQNLFCLHDDSTIIIFIIILIKLSCNIYKFYFNEFIIVITYLL